MDAVDDYIDPSHPDHERLAQAVENALDNAEIDTLEFSHSPSAPYRAVEFIAKKLGIEPQTSEVAVKEDTEREFDGQVGLLLNTIDGVKIYSLEASSTQDTMYYALVNSKGREQIINVEVDGEYQTPEDIIQLGVTPKLASFIANDINKELE